LKDLANNQRIYCTKVLIKMKRPSEKYPFRDTVPLFNFVSPKYLHIKSRKSFCKCRCCNKRGGGGGGWGGGGRKNSLVCVEGGRRKI
jgi:hypothetical protein